MDEAFSEEDLRKYNQKKIDEKLKKYPIYADCINTCVKKLDELINKRLKQTIEYDSELYNLSNEIYEKRYKQIPFAKNIGELKRIFEPAQLKSYLFYIRKIEELNIGYDLRIDKSDVFNDTYSFERSDTISNEKDNKVVQENKVFNEAPETCPSCRYWFHDKQNNRYLIYSGFYPTVYYCPKCLRKVKQTEIQCQNCGYDFKEVRSEKNTADYKLSNENINTNFYSDFFGFVKVILCIIGMIIVVFLVINI